MAIQPIRIVIQGIDKFSSTLGQSQKKIENFGRSISKAGRTLTMGLTVPLVAIGGMALKTTADFEQSMMRVGNLTGATGKDFQALEEQARQLGATTLHTASQAAEGMGFLGMAGFKTDQILSAMPATLDLATAGMVDLGRSADIMSNVLTGYNLKAEESTRVVDIMVDTMNSANTNMEQLAEAMKFVAPIAAGMKIPIEDTATAIGMLSGAGIQGAMAGTQLRGILGTLADPTNEAREALARLKIPKSAIIDSMGNVKDLATVIEQFEKSGATTADFLAIFNKRIGPGMAALVAQGSAAFRNLNTDIRDSGGEARKSAAAFEDSFIGQVKALRSALEELGIALFKDTGILKGMADKLKGMIIFVRKLGKTNPAILKLAFIFGLILAAVGPLLMVIGPIVTGIASIGGEIANAGGVIALLSNPIGWVIAGIMALIGMITYMASHIKTKSGNILAFMFPLGGIIAWIMARWQRLLPFIKLVLMGIGFLIKKFVEFVSPVVQPLIDMMSFLGGLIFDVLDKALSGLERLANIALPDWIKEKIGLSPIGAGGGGAAGMTERAVNSVNKNENTTNIKIENKANASVRTTTEKGSVNMDVDRGLVFGGEY